MLHRLQDSDRSRNRSSSLPMERSLSVAATSRLQPFRYRRPGSRLVRRQPQPVRSHVHPLQLAGTYLPVRVGNRRRGSQAQPDIAQHLGRIQPVHRGPDRF